jgi:hypothetical protein
MDAKVTTEQVHSIDIRRIKKPDIGSTEWYRGKQMTALLLYRVEPDRLLLYYFHRRHDGRWRLIEECVYLDRTPCHYGGERSWFMCPDCGKNVAVLYALRTRFACRHCHNLTYESTRENAFLRTLRRQKKALKQLSRDFRDSGPLQKPKGMRWRTYHRLLDEACHYSQESSAMLSDWKTRLTG